MTGPLTEKTWGRSWVAFNCIGSRLLTLLPPSFLRFHDRYVALSLARTNLIALRYGYDTILLTYIFMIADLRRLREGPHTIDEKPLKVINQPPKKKVPLDPLKVHVQGLNEKTTPDSLWLYLEKFSKVDVTEVYMGCNNNAMAVFGAEQGKKNILFVTCFCFLLFCCCSFVNDQECIYPKESQWFFLFLNICSYFWFYVFWSICEAVQFQQQSFKGIPSFETTVLSLIYAFSLGVVGHFFLFTAKLKLFRFYFL